MSMRSKLPGRLANVDQTLLQHSRAITAALPTLRARYTRAAADPTTPAADLADLQAAIRELERALGRIRFQPAGAATESARARGRLRKSEAHKYTEKRPNGRGGWTYIYADGHMATECDRCGGTGQHSYHTQRGTVCFKCNGAKVLPTTAKKEAAATAKHQAKLEREQAERAAAETRGRQSDVVMERLLERYKDRIGRELGHIDPQYHGMHVVEWFRKELAQQGIRPRSTFVGDLGEYLDKSAPQLLLTLHKGAAARSGSGQFARHGSAAHLSGHRRAYHAAKDAGEVAGTRRDWKAHLAAWAAGKEQHQVETLKDFHHLEADIRAMDEGPEKTRAMRKLKRMRRTLGR